MHLIFDAALGNRVVKALPRYRYAFHVTHSRHEFCGLRLLTGQTLMSVVRRDVDPHCWHQQSSLLMVLKDGSVVSAASLLQSACFTLARCALICGSICVLLCRDRGAKPFFNAIARQIGTRSQSLCHNSHMAF